jgi:tetratricopeptide (TPR) repeat protein
VAKQKKQDTKNKKPETAVAEQLQVTNPVMQFPTWAPYLIIFIFSILLYSNTLWNRYAIDDTIVVTDNKFTKKGFGGIKDHFTHDMFEGFFGERGAKLVSGGRYRPLSMVSLAVEYELTRKIRGDKRDVITEKNIIMTDNDPYLNPMLSHAINILLFALTGVLLFYLLSKLLPQKKSTPFFLSLPFIITMLYAAHPMHTEAVANIKGRDEVMCMLFSVLSLIAAVRYSRTKNITDLIGGALIYFIALMSKENAITFFAVIPLTYFFFTNVKAKDYALTLGIYLAPVVAFLLLRGAYTQSGLTQESPEILNNPFIAPYNEFGIRYGTTIYTFLLYYWLMIFPHPLTHDYYFNQIAYVGFDSIWVWFAIIITVGAVVYALLNLKKKTLPSFAILFFFSTFSVASNVLFTVGVLMNERFIYMSSLGFCMLLAYLLVHFIKNKNALTATLLVVLSLYSVKTFSRNFDWKDSFTLFRRDVVHSSNSAKIQTSVGGDLTKAADSNIPTLRDSGMIKAFFNDLSNGQKSSEELNAINMLPDSSIRNMLLDSSIAHLNEAIRIYQTHSNAWLLLGNALYKRYHNPQQVIPVYEKAGAYRVGGYYDAYFNLGIVYNELNAADSARVNLLRAYELKPEQMEPRFLLAQTYAKLNRPDSVEYWLKRGAEVKQPDAGDYYQIGTGFGKVAHNLNAAIAYLKKAVELNPKAELYYEDLAVAYGLSGQYDEAIATSQKLVEVNPKYPAGYFNLSVSWRNKGNTNLANEYYEKARALNPAYPPLPQGKSK